MFKVIFLSRKPEAEAFTDWVTSQVLPSIRKTGMYLSPNAAPNLGLFKSSILESVGKSLTENVVKAIDKAIENKLGNLEERVREIEGRGVCMLDGPRLPKPANTWSLEEIAQEFHTRAWHILSLLKSIRLVAGRNVIGCRTRSIVAEGYFVNLPHMIVGSNSVGDILVTAKGRREILDALPTYKKQHPELFAD